MNLSKKIEALDTEAKKMLEDLVEFYGKKNPNYHNQKMLCLKQFDFGVNDNNEYKAYHVNQNIILDFQNNHRSIGGWSTDHLCIILTTIEKQKRIALSTKIKTFLEEFGRRDANEPDYWNSPDACWLEEVEVFHLPNINSNGFHWVGSSYMHGGYKKGGQEIHDEILEELSFMRDKLKI